MNYTDLRLEEKVVLMLIRDNANFKGESTISLDAIANECGNLFKISKKKTYLITNKLIENGFISIVLSNKRNLVRTYIVK